MSGIELWKSDGTALGTVQVKDINLSGDSFPSGFTVFNNELYFSADGGTGFELWKTNGTPGNAALVKDINPTGDSDFPAVTIIHYYLAFDAGTGSGLCE